jgi:Fe-S cluster assembly iron-binding protein IscA
MSKVSMSDIAYEDFKQLLAENNIDSDTIRIYVAGIG